MKFLRSVQRSLVTILVLVVFVCLAFLSIYGFVRKVQLNEITIADQTLLTAANNGASLIQTIFNDYSMGLAGIAVLYEQEDDPSSEESLAMLNDIAQKNGYDRLAVDYPDGTTYTSDGHIFDMSAFGYLDKIKRGESFVTDVLPAIADGEDVISFLTPLHNDEGEPIASLRLTMETASMTDAINISLFNSEGYYHLVDENGMYVAADVSPNALLMNQNFFEAIAGMDYKEGYSAEDIKASFVDGTSGFSKYSVDGSKRYAYYQPAGINSWVLMTIVPQEVIAKAEQQNISLAIVMTIQLSAILILIFVYIYLMQRKARKTAVLNDKCFRALAEQTNKVIFEWDFASGNIVAMNNFKELFGREMVTQNSALEALDANMVYPDDQVEFKRVFSTILSGSNVENIRFRVKHANGEYHWCALSGIVIFDNARHPYKAIGSLEDINDVVINEENMKQKAETDQLTGLYNKTETEQRIKGFLESGVGDSALMIVDIDNFKDVNDSLGHQFGDRVLIDFAEVLKSFSNENNIIGRIGGDEFFLFFGNYIDDTFIHKNAEEICRLFARTYTNDCSVRQVSASIGIAFYPRDGVDFGVLYKCADIALYRAKAIGKNGYMVYDASLGNQVASRTEIDEPLG